MLTKKKKMSEKNFGSKNFWSNRTLSQKIFGKKNVGSKKFEFQKILSPKKVLSARDFCPKKVCVQ